MDSMIDCRGHMVSSKQVGADVPVPDYLRRHYWFAYLYPWMVAFWDHLVMVNMVLLGNYSHLRDITLAYFAKAPTGNVLQVASVYGDLIPKLSELVRRDGGTFDLIDVLPLQLGNARRKLDDAGYVRLFNIDASRIDLPTAHCNRVLYYFLLHELPDEVFRQTLHEAFRLVNPGGEVVIVDFAKPYWWNPFRYLWCAFLAVMEPFALGLWWNQLSTMVPARYQRIPREEKRFFGGLLQMVVFRA